MVFKPNCTIFSMIQPEPFPGSYRNQGMGVDEIIERSLKEVQMVIDNGFDGIIIQNMNDMPIKQVANIETIAFMTRLGTEIRNRYPSLIIGVLINWDGLAALAVAEAMKADFVRVEHLYTGAEVTSAGILQAQCVEICELRKKLNSKIPVYADIYEVHGVAIGRKSFGDAAWEAVNEAFADGLFVSGKTVEESIAIIQEIKKRVPNTPVLLGGGANGSNIRELMNYYDGVSVATWIKDGDMKNPINPERAKQFIEQVNLAKQDRK